MAERIAEGLSKPLNLDAFRGTPGTTPEAGRTEPRASEAMSRGAALATGDRMDEYGDPNLSFDRIAGLWSAYVTAPGVDAAALTAEDVARMMILLKVSRSLTDTKADTLDDIDGYTACIRLLRGIDVT